MLDKNLVLGVLQMIPLTLFVKITFRKFGWCIYEIAVSLLWHFVAYFNRQYISILASSLYFWEVLSYNLSILRLKLNVCFTKTTRGRQCFTLLLSNVWWKNITLVWRRWTVKPFRLQSKYLIPELPSEHHSPGALGPLADLLGGGDWSLRVTHWCLGEPKIPFLLCHIGGYFFGVWGQV